MILLFALAMGTHLKVSVWNRVVSKGIDLLLIFLVAAILPYPVGPLLGFTYSLLADGMNFGNFQGQSVGKKLTHLQVVNVITKKPANWKDSALRNSPIGVATFFAIIPVWGWLILFMIGLPLMAIEVYLMLSVESGHRLGDAMADTEVLERKRVLER